MFNCISYSDLKDVEEGTCVSLSKKETKIIASCSNENELYPNTSSKVCALLIERSIFVAF